MWKLVILVVANFVLWSALVLRLFGVNTGRVAVIAVIVVSAFGISFASGLYSSRIIHGVVTAESTIGRLGDSLSYEPAFDAPLYSGVEFTVKQRRVGWILAGLPNDELVWIEEADCGLIEEDL